MQKYEAVKDSRKSIVVNNFIGGIAWAVGSTIGLTIAIALIGFLLARINLIPVIGDWASEITKVVIEKNSVREK